jgi:leucyl/phenylalanyl-tRNA--protein transferase
MKSSLVTFPPVEYADEEGFLAWGGDLEPETLRLAYLSGIFPWPMDNLPLLWFAPPERAILRLGDFHISRSLQKLLRQKPWQMRVDADFDAVIEACARAPRRGQDGTWITRDMQRAYKRLHQSGEAHSIEIYLENELVGGLYGVSWGSYFAGESMFHHVSGASKVALVFLVEHLQKQGVTWLDCEVLNPLFESFGAKEIPRDDFMGMLKAALKAPAIEWNTDFIHGNITDSHGFDEQ